jgi:hypothetical protein
VISGSWFGTASSDDDDLRVVARSVASSLSACEPGLVMLFSSPRHDLRALLEAARAELPHAEVCGCTTAGEIHEHGFGRGGVSAFAVGGGCGAASTMIASLKRFHFEDAQEVVGLLARRLELEPDDLDPERNLFILLTDGLSVREEILVASLGLTAPGIPLVGGSAGDDFRFKRTLVGRGGTVRTDAAVLVLLDLEAHCEAHPFHVNHYRPTETSVKVTSADASTRLIHELDGRPAVEVYAELLGIDASELEGRPVEGFRGRILQFGMQLGNRHFVRSVFTARDGSLFMGGAVEPGTTLTLMRPEDLVARTRAGLAQAITAIDGLPEGLLLFDCGGRLLEARALGVERELGRASVPLPATGFTTYGEQYNAFHANHTLTGLVLGRTR